MTKPALQCLTRRNGLIGLGLLIAFMLPSNLCAQAQERIAPTESRVAREAHTYRVTYTLTESDSGKRVGVQRYAMTVVANARPAVLKQGTKNPVLTGGYLHENAPETTQFQFTYLDTGVNLSTTVNENPEGLQLTAKVEQSSMVDSVNPQTLRDPSVRQNVIECSSVVKPGTPVVIGSYDVPNSTHRWEIEAMVERVS